MKINGVIVAMLALAGFARAEECEPNDSPETGALLQPAPCVEVQAEVSPIGDQDYFQLVSAGGERLWVSALTDSDTVVALYRPDGSLLESDDDDGSGLGSLIAGAHLDDPGTYYLQVYRYSNTSTCSYDLYVTMFDGLDMVPETGTSNETAALAQEVGTGCWISGSFGSATDLDWYEFTAAAGDMLVFQFDDDPERSGTGAFDAVLGLYSSSGTSLLDESDHEGKGPDEPEDLFYYNSTSRTLWLCVESDTSSGFVAGSYALAINVAAEHSCIGTPTPVPSATPVVPTPSTTPTPVPTETPPPSPTPTTAPFLIRIFDNRFQPAVFRVDPGGVVAWRNEGSNLHTSTSNGGTWNSGTMLPKDIYARAFSGIGIYNYHCEFYPSIEGRIICGLATPTRPPTPVPTATPVPSPTMEPVMPPVGGDYDGDGLADIALFRPSSGLWLVRGLTRIWYGIGTDIPVPGEYSGDRTWDIAVFRPSLGKWMVRGVTSVFYGVSTDLPVPADYDGDGAGDIALFRPSIGKWLVRGVTQAYYGFSTDTVVPGDYDGNGTADTAVFRPSIGKWLARGVTSVYYGNAADTVVPGDYTGDGTWDAAVFRPSSGKWLVKDGPYAYWGTSGDAVQPADYDGDGAWDFAVFRPSSGRWLIRGISSAYYGTSTDLPVTNP
ncbi:MAG TPA: hypothetical protein PK636_01480 [bacterium]|nr:hypothetical protein [bacterium]